MVSVSLVLIVLAAILTGLAAFNVPAGRVNLIAAALFCWFLSLLI